MLKRLERTASVFIKHCLLCAQRTALLGEQAALLQLLDYVQEQSAINPGEMT